MKYKDAEKRATKVPYGAESQKTILVIYQGQTSEWILKNSKQAKLVKLHSNFPSKHWKLDFQPLLVKSLPIEIQNYIKKQSQNKGMLNQFIDKKGRK